MAKVYQHSAAKRDLVEHFVYLAENAGLDTAERFLANAEASFSDLAASLPMYGEGHASESFQCLPVLMPFAMPRYRQDCKASRCR